MNLAQRFQSADPNLAVAHCLAALDEGAEPPSERLIFPAGEFKTTKGTFLFDTDAAKAVMADWQEWTGGLPQKGSSDYEHDQAKENLPGHLKLDSSSYDLEVRSGALWAVNIRWTELAAGMISKREKRYTSPWWLYEKATKRIVRYINFGLVSLPATIAQQELIPAAASVQVPESFAACFAGYMEPPAAPPPAAVAPTEPSASASAGPDKHEFGARAEPEQAAPEQAPEIAKMAKDPNFQPTRHSYALRYMASTAMENMMTSIMLNAEVPMTCADLGLDKHCAAMADHVSKCAEKMAQCMEGQKADDMDDAAPDEASITAAVEKLPAEFKAPVEKALAACKAAKMGGLLQRAHKAALASVGCERFDSAAVQKLQGTKDLVASVFSLTKQSSLGTASAALQAISRDLAEAPGKAAEAAAAAEKAQQEAEKAKKEAEAAAAAADQKEYDRLIESNRKKIPAGKEEAWVRANIKGDEKLKVKPSEALAAYIAAKGEVTIAQTHEQGAAGGAANAAAARQQTEEQRAAIIAATDPDPQALAGWAQTGGGEERLLALRENQAKKLGLIQ